MGTAFPMVVKIYTYAAAGVLAGCGVYRFTVKPNQNVVLYYIISLYCLIFAGGIIVSNLGKPAKFFEYISFLTSKIGLGLFMIFVGLLIFATDDYFSLAASIVLFIGGGLNIFIHCNTIDS